MYSFTKSAEYRYSTDVHVEAEKTVPVPASRPQAESARPHALVMPKAVITTLILGMFASYPLALIPPNMSAGFMFRFQIPFLFIISGISRRIHMWEGAMYLTIYVFFIGKLFDFI